MSKSRAPKPSAHSPKNAKPAWAVYCGDSRELLLDLQPASVDCVVTSPPYFWQRDYGVTGQTGMEPTVQGFVDNLVEVFSGVKHVLADTGTVFLNLGDTFYNKKGRPHGEDPKHTGRQFARTQLRAVDGPGLGFQRKSLLGMPWRVALAMMDDGWTLRSEIVWRRKSAMPEPTALDRPWRQHEHIFMFSKSPKYFFDRDALGGEEDVWDIEPERRSPTRGLHYAPYPSELVERCLGIGCPPGGTVLDPFAGGGTTLDVANKMGLNSIGVELNPGFCEIIAGRLPGGVSRAPKLEARAVGAAS